MSLWKLLSNTINSALGTNTVISSMQQSKTHSVTPDRIVSSGKYQINLDCRNCRCYGYICSDCKRKIGEQLHFGQVEMTVPVQITIPDEITFFRKCVRHVPSNKLIGDITNTPVPSEDSIGSIIYVAERQGERPIAHFIHSKILSKEELHHIARLLNQKWVELCLQHEAYLIEQRNISIERQAKELEKQKAFQEYKQLRMATQLKKIKQHRSATCWKCRKGLSTHRDILCYSCDWIQCDCGACGCNYHGR